MGNRRGTVLNTHKIVFRIHGGKTRVSCECRASYEKHSRTKGGGEYYEPFEVRRGETVWEAYNRPENHWVEFRPEDRIRV